MNNKGKCIKITIMKASSLKPWSSIRGAVSHKPGALQDDIYTTFLTL